MMVKGLGLVLLIGSNSNVMCFNKQTLLRVQPTVEEYLSGLKQAWSMQQYPGGAWLVKGGAMAIGKTKEEIDAMSYFGCLVTKSVDDVQQWFKKQTDEKAHAIYAFANEAQNIDDLIKKQNERDKPDNNPLTEEKALQRLAESALYKDIVEPTRKNS
jgi:hypothetical protein